MGSFSHFGQKKRTILREKKKESKDVMGLGNLKW